MNVITQEYIQKVSFNIILESGDGRKFVSEAFEAMRTEEFDVAEALLKLAKEAIIRAHQSQTELLQQYASGENFNTDILMVHAQDHLMSTMTLKDVALEMLYLHKKLK